MNIRTPPRFNKPTLISEKLSNFLNKPENIEMSRIEVTEKIMQYVWDNNLESNTKNREINCDEKLAHLLNVDEELDEVNIFNIRRYLKHNYPDDFLK